MINLGKKMILAPGPRQSRAELAVAKRAAKRRNSSDDPKHQESKSRVDINDLKSEAGENAGTDNVCDDNSAGRRKSDRSRRFRRSDCVRFGDFVHCRLDNGI